MNLVIAGLMIGAVSFVAPLVAPKSAGQNSSAARNVRSGAIFGALIAVQLIWLIAKRVPGSIGWLAVSLLLVATAQVAGRTLERALRLIDVPGGRLLGCGQSRPGIGGESFATHRGAACTDGRRGSWCLMTYRATRRSAGGGLEAFGL